MSTRQIQITDEAVAKYKDTSIDDALLQAIFNGIDAGATDIQVKALSRKGTEFDFGDDNEPVSQIQISDNGTGIPFDRIAEMFEPFERSWKKNASPTGMARYHGEKGCGRFKCFALGAELEWKTVYRLEDGRLFEYTMKLDVSSAKNLVVDDEPTPSSKDCPGTVLTVNSLTNKFFKQFNEIEKLSLDILIQSLVDIEAYHKRIVFFGKLLNPTDVKVAETTFPFRSEDLHGVLEPGSVRVIAWKDSAQFVGHKHSFYYDQNGRFVAKRPSGLYADTHFPAHTLIVTSSALANYSDLEADFGEVFAKIEKAIRMGVVRFLVEVKQQTFSDVLNQLFENDSYPFKQQPKTPLEEAKVTAFNAVLGALAFDNPALITPKKKAILQMVFPLLARLMSGDALLGDNIDRLLELDNDHSNKFNRVFSRIKLSSIIDRYNRIQHRYAFLETLNKLVHVSEYSEELKERTQLHKIVEQEIWIFGPEYEQRNLITSDKSLTTLLREHVVRDDIFFDAPSEQGKLETINEFIENNKDNVEKCLQKIPDLVLAKRVKTDFSDNSTQFLVIELKRPTVKIDKTCRDQARDVFTGILNGTKGGGLLIDDTHRWRYCLVSTGIADELIPEFGENHHLEVKMGGKYVIDVLKWTSIIEDARKRLDEEMSDISVEVNDPDCQELLAQYGKLFGMKSLHP